MPELPEVEAARRAIEEHCIGKKIKKAIIADDSKVIDGVSPSDFVAALVGKTIVSALRKGKNLWLQLDSPPFPSFQFGMAGAVYIKGVAVTKYKRSAVNDSDEWPSKYSKFFVQLDDGLELSFTDKRRFAKVRLLEDPASKPPISELGPDALLEPMTVDELHGSLSKKKVAIKALLLDQSFVSGIGNWIADEVLYQARIHPLQIASSLSRESSATLHKCIKEVVQYAVEVDADCDRFPLEWLFHFRWGKKPGKVNGKEIDFIVAGGRTTAYVPGLQKLNGNQAGKAVGKPKARTSKKKRDGDDDDNDNNEDGGSEPTSEDEKIARKAKSKRELRPKGPGKKPSAKRKSKASDTDSEEDEGAATAAAADDDQKKKPRRVTSRKQVMVGKAPKKLVNNQNTNKPRKKVK
ncbi:formamidopyrimidine-DNA glycosylase isoform X2 [Populus trichocarpa]|uniref:Formamidopyrimidine-DNA glycosylase catalytic domain-containing protein n=1 Tax=Populus trichocarpa TaxID=3694 RepID=A0A2K2B0U0_POPTR|nr:formamidopyrimidine-DNA glycosylase isoform X2 [Populus trichocarpa]|eukprot:XP_024454071.1 formamidopyrimidine-DNA glycosylase isoform X2 [Populus trichocarpa]